MSSREASLAWDSPVSELSGVGSQRRHGLRRLGIGTIGDLLWHLPYRYENRQTFSCFPPGSREGSVLLRGRVTVMPPIKFLPGRRRLCEVIIEPVESFALVEPVTLAWVNMPFIRKGFAVGQELVVFGRLQYRGKRWTLWFPEFEMLETNEASSLHLGRIVPIYRAAEGISVRFLREMTAEALDRLEEKSVMPSPIRAVSDANTAPLMRWRMIHLPSDEEEIESARRGLAAEEALASQIKLARLRILRSQKRTPARGGDGSLTTPFLSRLPYPPTGAQHRVMLEIRRDLSAPTRMARLLQGDVGSGKTMVAAYAILSAIEAGWHAVLMVPTQVLAKQHYRTFQHWLKPLGVGVELITAEQSMSSEPLFDRVEQSGWVRIGTHALLYQEAATNVGLVVVDEQHKFGVEQRARLADMPSEPDVLVMTATPIPRTLALTLYGDLAVSVIDEMPPGRVPIVTKIKKTDSELETLTAFLLQELKKGRQAYLVFPLVEEGEGSEAKAATTEFRRWQKKLAPYGCGLLHGRMKQAEKDKAVEEFQAGKTVVLIATTVVEVGVDVPNATIMVIFDAERFGLAQLHQLRGRVGRGSHPSYCALVPSASADEGALERLQVLEATNDGFEIAEADLRLRGAGRVLGTAQSGGSGFRLLNPTVDVDLLVEARKQADALLQNNDDLTPEVELFLRQMLSREEKAFPSQAGA